MSKRSNWRWVIVIVTVALVLGEVAYLHTESAGFEGWWLKQSGGGYLPDQMTLHISTDAYQMRYWDHGISSVTVPIDGHPHLVSVPFNSALGGARDISSAQDKETLLISRTLAVFAPGNSSIPVTELTWAESWKVNAKGRLVVSTPGREDIVYLRASI